MFLKKKANMRKIPGSMAGFTMIEVVVVLIILGILAVVAISRIPDLREYDVTSEAQIVKSHLRYAQSKAMNTSEVWGINFLTSTTYALFKNGNTSNRVRLPGEGSLNRTLSSGITLSPTGIVVSFDSWGSPYQNADGTNAQSGDRSITLSAGGSSKSITIKPKTGYMP